MVICPEELYAALSSGDEETRRSALDSLRAVPLRDSGDFLFRAMGDQSWRVRKEAVDVFIGLKPDESAVETLLDLLREEENAGLRNSAAETLTRLGPFAAVALTKRALDPDPDVRKFILDVMGAIGGSDFVPALIAALADQDVNVASAAAEHLGNVNDPRAVPELIRAIIARNEVFFRFSALEALGRLDSHERVPDEIVALADQDILRKGVYACLGSIGDESSAAVLLEGFVAPQKSSRKTAISSWYRVFSRSSATARSDMEQQVRSFTTADLVPILIGAFDVSDTHLAAAVTALIGILSDQRGIGILLSSFADERLSGVALTSLKRLGARGMDTLLALFNDGSAVTRCAVVTVIGELSHHPGERVVRDALSDPSPAVRKAAVTAAAKLCMTSCIPLIAALLDDENRDVRPVVIASLQAMSLIDRNALQEVARNLVESPQPYQRRDAAILFAALGDGERLSLLAKDENATVRQAAVTSIGRLNRSADQQVICYALVDEDTDVRIAAAEALGEIGSGDASSALMLALNDEDIWVKCAVLRSLARIDAAQALVAIQSLFPRAEGLLMVTCLELLEVIGGAGAIEMVEEALGCRDADAVRLAVAILSRLGGEWVTANAERILSHVNPTARRLWAAVLATLPPAQARQFLAAACQTEQDEIVKTELVRLLDGIA